MFQAMKIQLVAAAAVLFAAGCAPAETTSPGSEDTASTSEAVVDASALYLFGPRPRPTPTFDPATGLTRAHVRHALLDDEPVLGVEGIGTRTDVFLTAGFRVERRIADGDLHVTRRESTYVTPGEGSVDPEQLQAQSIDLLSDLGIPASEMGARRQRRVLGIDSEEREARRTVSHATFVGRAFHGVEVLGSRAVVVHDPAGRFKRLLLDWPAVAQGSSHQWGTSMSVAAIQQRAASELAGRGLAGRAATLRYVYAPISRGPADSQVYALKCQASIEALPEGHPDGPDKARRILIDLDP